MISPRSSAPPTFQGVPMSNLSLSDLLWIATLAYGLHALEEFILDWRDWARAVIGLPVEWSHFYVVNFLVIVLGICCAQIGKTQPALALSMPALMLINATFFHVVPMLVTRGRYSPGTFSAVVLFYPLGIACYQRALVDGSVTAGGIALSFVIGALLMATPIMLLRIKDRPYFRQS
jgi:hypothetical protein